MKEVLVGGAGCAPDPLKPSRQAGLAPKMIEELGLL
jgi:hypothetical protein